MDCTRGLFVLFQQKAIRLFRRPDIQSSIANSPFAKLPTELLQQVAADLPVASAVSFSLSCRYIYRSIGTQYIESLATSDHETLAFLKLVEHDLPNQIVCDSCRKLHRMRDARKYTKYGRYYLAPKEPDCYSDDRSAIVMLFIHEDFTTTVFKMAMKHHHLFGYDALSRKLLKLLSGEFCSTAWGSFVRNREVECRIKNGSLFTCKRMTVRGKCKDVNRYTIHDLICPHLECRSVERPASLYITTSRDHLPQEKWSILLPCENGTNIKSAPRDICSEIYQCRYCRTEYAARFRHDDSGTMKLTITVWKDLGKGPETEEWMAHFPFHDRRINPQSIQFQRGELAAVFQVRGDEPGQR